jgi:NAD+ diphosphatase
MIGFAAAADGRVPLHPADGEIESAQWVPRATVREALTTELPDLKLPGPTSIAYQMIKGWAQAD